MEHLCISVRWLDDRYHGLTSRDGSPEWPPSPYRLLQALVAGVACSGGLNSEAEQPPRWLQWLEKLDPPIIVAPLSCPGQIITRFVPNNDGDQIPDRQNRLTGKTSRPTIMLDVPQIHYLWLLPNGKCSDIQALIRGSRFLSTFGWGIDMAFADARVLSEAQVADIKGIRWLPKPGAACNEGVLRVPVEGTIADLLRAHRSAKRRIEDGKPLRTIDKPQVFDEVFYASAQRSLGRPYVLFTLRTREEEFFSYSQAKLIHIAGMTRRAAITAMQAYPPESISRDKCQAWVESSVAGHRTHDSSDHKQFSYLPLPSIGHEHADGNIRRIMILAPFGWDDYLLHLAEQLEGQELTPEHNGEGPILDRLKSDGVTRRYIGSSAEWVSVTPAILPGHDDHKPAKTEKLIQKALLQSGIEQPCTFSWGAVPNFRNSLSAYRHDRQGRPVGYFRPDHLQSLTAVHLRLRFQSVVAGPLAIGSGRHCGLGIMARVGE